MFCLAQVYTSVCSSVGYTQWHSIIFSELINIFSLQATSTVPPMDADCEALPKTRRFSSSLALLLGVLLADTLGCQHSLENVLLKETGNPKSCPLSGWFVSSD